MYEPKWIHVDHALPEFGDDVLFVPDKNGKPDFSDGDSILVAWRSERGARSWRWQTYVHMRAPDEWDAFIWWFPLKAMADFPCEPDIAKADQT
ncbi:MAG: hypothetical protein KJZ75_11340 [Hyphomonadaceae bacterium]|nr:hypothetical protein [Hyphomonadaceae bacterium]